MSELADRLQADLNASRKAQDKPLTLVLGSLLADVKNRRIELRRDPTDDEVIDLVRRGIKRRRESVEMYRTGGREDLEAKESAEIAILERYLPPAVDEAEIRAAARAVVSGGAGNLGAIMGRLIGQYKGRVDGSVLNRIAREELAAGMS
ncbi:aspartyl-tRNA amidotransferase subunit B [Gemmatimonadetes bacterium T265]|nr:aspartyl-tRNA amidotransferase subunit B [Gemmatimonadetes bacterium T265]